MLRAATASRSRRRACARSSSHFDAEKEETPRLAADPRADHRRAAAPDAPAMRPGRVPAPPPAAVAASSRRLRFLAPSDAPDAASATARPLRRRCSRLKVRGRSTRSWSAAESARRAIKRICHARRPRAAARRAEGRRGARADRRRVASSVLERSVEQRSAAGALGTRCSLPPFRRRARVRGRRRRWIARRLTEAEVATLASSAAAARRSRCACPRCTAPDAARSRARSARRRGAPSMAARRAARLAASDALRAAGQALLAAAASTAAAGAARSGASWTGARRPTRCASPTSLPRRRAYRRARGSRARCCGRPRGRARRAAGRRPARDRRRSRRGRRGRCGDASTHRDASSSWTCPTRLVATPSAHARAGARRARAAATTVIAAADLKRVAAAARPVHHTDSAMRSRAIHGRAIAERDRPRRLAGAMHRGHAALTGVRTLRTARRASTRRRARRACSGPRRAYPEPLRAPIDLQRASRLVRGRLRRRLRRCLGGAVRELRERRRCSASCGARRHRRTGRVRPARPAGAIRRRRASRSSRRRVRPRGVSGLAAVERRRSGRRTSR